MASKQTTKTIEKVSHAAFGPIKDWTCDIYQGSSIITSIDVRARTGTEAVVLAAQSLKVKPRKNYNAK